LGNTLDVGWLRLAYVNCEGDSGTPFVTKTNSLIPKIYRGNAKCLMVTQWMTGELHTDYISVA